MGNFIKIIIIHVLNIYTLRADGRSLPRFLKEVPVFFGGHKSVAIGARKKKFSTLSHNEYTVTRLLIIIIIISAVCVRHKNLRYEAQLKCI